MVRLSETLPGQTKQYFLQRAAKYIEKNTPQTMLSGFAYASVAGVKTFLKNLHSVGWDGIDKRVILGIDQGITEPEAIRLLLDEANMSIRLFIPGQKLRKEALFIRPLFHPKFLYLDSSVGVNRHFLFVSSSNLTGAALGPKIKNFELGQVTTFGGSPVNDLAVDKLSSWWNTIWGQSTLVTAKLIETYSSLRVKTFKSNPDLLYRTEPAEDIRDATVLWIEVGKASGIERHQVEFPKLLATFFGKPKKKRIDLTLRNSTGTWTGRPLSHKKTTYNVDIWRLGMPTVKKGGLPIQNRIIRFERTSTSSEFKFQVADIGSSKGTAWENECSKLGHIGKTGGAHARMYGYI